MSLNLEVNPLTPKNKKKIKKLLFQTNLKLYKIFVNIISFVHITINLHINSKNPWLSYAKIQEILRALSTYIYLVIQLLLYSLWNHCWAMGWEVVGGPVEMYVLL